jgi:probable HAF family extracellular repeat protein
VKRIITLLFGSCLLLFAASTCFAQMYTVIELDRLGIPTSAYLTPGGINNAGRAVYSLGIHGLYATGFRTDPNSATSYDLGYFCCSGEYRTVPYSINASGQVAGTSIVSFYLDHAFRTAPNSPIDPTSDLGTLGIDSHGSGINDSGQVVGWSWISGDQFNQVTHAFRTAPNSSINPSTDDLGTLGGTNSYATSINALGQVAGYSSISGDAIIHAFRTTPNSSINATTDDLGTLGGSQSYAYGINAFGQVVGYSTIPGDKTTHAFRTAPNSGISAATDDLGTLGESNSYGKAINSWGEVVGKSAEDYYSLGSGFLYSGGIVHDLNQFILAAPGYLIYDAVAINDVGEILASTAEPGEVGGPYGFRGIVLLTPIYNGFVQQPINSNGTSVFSAKRGVIPVKFEVTQYGTQPSCSLPATIGIVRAGNGTLAAVDENSYSNPADSGSNFRIDPTACQYIYNLAASSLGVGTYRVDISINGIMVGHAVFALK